MEKEIHTAARAISYLSYLKEEDPTRKGNRILC
jgi:hypothetical protein